MKKITINEIEQVMKPDLSSDQLKEQGYEQGDGGKQVEAMINNLEVQLAIRKLTKREQEIVQMVIDGFSHREIQDELKVSHHTIRATLDKIRSIIK